MDIGFMSKPMEDQTDRELEEALAQGRLDERKTAAATEILSRRQQAKAVAIKRRFGWLGGVMATLSLALVTLKRLWTRLNQWSTPKSHSRIMIGIGIPISQSRIPRIVLPLLFSNVKLKTSDSGVSSRLADKLLVRQSSPVPRPRSREAVQGGISGDSRYFKKPYYLLHGDHADEGYIVLRDALAKTKKVAIGQLDMGGRRHLVGITAQGKGVALSVLRYADELFSTVLSTFTWPAWPMVTRGDAAGFGCRLWRCARLSAIMRWHRSASVLAPRKACWDHWW
jgi:hypothetical protein